MRHDGVAWGRGRATFPSLLQFKADNEKQELSCGQVWESTMVL
jgi:hypothetical protein